MATRARIQRASSFQRAISSSLGSYGAEHERDEWPERCALERRVSTGQGLGRCLVTFEADDYDGNQDAADFRIVRLSTGRPYYPDIRPSHQAVR
jgi:hypothetical protein